MLTKESIFLMHRSDEMVRQGSEKKFSTEISHHSPLPGI